MDFLPPVSAPPSVSATGGLPARGWAWKPVLGTCAASAVFAITKGHIANMPSPLPRQDRRSPLIAHCGFRRRRPSPNVRRVGSRVISVETCSAFTHVAACSLARSPCDPLPRRLPPVRYLPDGSRCYRVERSSSRAGLAPAEDRRLCTAHDGDLLYWWIVLVSPRTPYGPMSPDCLEGSGLGLRIALNKSITR
jgi:hypothetical protein